MIWNRTFFISGIRIALKAPSQERLLYLRIYLFLWLCYKKIIPDNCKRSSCNCFLFFHLLSSEGLYLSGKTFTLIPSTFQPALLVLQGINFWVLPTWNIWYRSLWCLRHGTIVLCHLRTFKISNFRFLSRHSYFSEIS